MTTIVINTAHGGRADVDIMRPSKWGNPYAIGRDGDRATCIQLYKKHIARSPELLSAIAPELYGKSLGCCCHPQLCHGDYLAHLANNPDKVEELLQAYRLAEALGFCAKPGAVSPWLKGTEDLDASSLDVQAFLTAPPPRDRTPAKMRRAAAEIKAHPEVLRELHPASAEQEEVINRLVCSNAGEIHILVGRAGSGKSEVIKHLQQRTRITICATTAKAALLVGGITVDRLFCYNREHNNCWKPDRLEKMMRDSERIIVIDEGSMSGEKMSDYLYSTARVYNKTLIVVGDWAQAAPVKDKWFFDSRLYTEATIHHLTGSFRQNEGSFLAALDALRTGSMTSEHYKIFDPCLLHGDERLIEGDDRYTRLMATNAEVDRYNQTRMNALPKVHPDVYLDARAFDTRHDKAKEKYPRRPGHYSELLKEGPMAHGGVFRLGSRVMVCLNLNQAGYVNGDAGVLIDALLRRDLGPEHRGLPAIGQEHLDAHRRAEGETRRALPGEPPLPPDFWVSECTSSLYAVDSDDIELLVLRMERTGEIYLMERARLEQTDPGQKPHTVVVGFPLMLSWAQTAHRCQGQSLDHVFVRMESILKMKTKESMHGLAYVMLSRAKTLEGLKISRWTPEAIHCDPQTLCLIDPTCEAAVETSRIRTQAANAIRDAWNAATLGNCEACGGAFRHVQMCNCGSLVCRECAPRHFPDSCPRCTTGIEREDLSSW